MSKQSAKDRGPSDIHSLLVTDSGWDSDTSVSGSARNYVYERDIATTRPLNEDEKLQLLRMVQEKAKAQLEPGLAVTMVTYETKPCEHTFLVSVQ